MAYSKFSTPVSINFYQEEDTELWLLAGQSNATAIGVLSEVDEKYTGEFDFEVYHRNTPASFTTGDEFKVVDTDNATQMGTFFSTTHFPINHILSYIRGGLIKKTFFINYAIGGTQIYEDGGLVDWNVNSDEYAEWLIDIIGFAETELTTREILYTQKSLIWFQGESDTDETKSAAYKQNTIDLFAAIRVAIPNLHIYLCQIHSRVGHEYTDVIRTLQAEIAAADANITLVDLDGIFVDNDVHLTSDGVVSTAELINTLEVG